MSEQKKSLIILLALQIVAIILYPPAFLMRARQAQVLPPTLLFLFALALVAMNTGFLNPDGGRSSLAFVQGVNIVVRLMMLLPNLRSAEGNWNWALLLANLIAIGISWYTMTQIDQRPLNTLLLKSTREASPDGGE